MIARMATTAPNSCSDSVRTKGMIATGSAEIRLSRRLRAGHKRAVSTLPITASLIRPFRKLTSATLENIRLAPASGEILENFGARASADQISRCWIALPTIAASVSSRNGSATAAMVSTPTCRNSTRSPPPSAGMR